MSNGQSITFSTQKLQMAPFKFCIYSKYYLTLLDNSLSCWTSFLCWPSNWILILLGYLNEGVWWWFLLQITSLLHNQMKQSTYFRMSWALMLWVFCYEQKSYSISSGRTLSRLNFNFWPSLFTVELPWKRNYHGIGFLTMALWEFVLK